MKNLLLIPVLLLAFCHQPDMTQIKYFKDTQGRICIYHGLNVSNYSKSSPDFTTWQTPEDIRKMTDWGFNLTRLLIFWEAIEPIPGQYNKEYLDKVNNTISQFRANGIEVFLDIHQDLYAKKFTGNGFPAWAINDNGLKFEEQKPWNKNYTQPAVLASYMNFWSNDTLKKKYVDMVCYTAEYFKNTEGVIGIDVMNEPFPGLSVRSFERKTLSDLYDSIQTRFIKSGNKMRIFFEPWMLTSTGTSTTLSFDPTVDAAYAPHFYDPSCHEGFEYSATNKILMKKALLQKAWEAQQFHSPLIIGETGISEKVKGFKNFLGDFMDLSDSLQFNWTYYAYDVAGGFGVIDANKNPTAHLGILIRPYPQKIAGINPVYSYKNRVFTLHYELSEAKGPTIVYLPTTDNIKIQTTGIYTITGHLLYYTGTVQKNQDIEITWEN